MLNDIKKGQSPHLALKEIDDGRTRARTEMNKSPGADEMQKSHIPIKHLTSHKKSSSPEPEQLESITKMNQSTLKNAPLLSQQIRLDMN